MVRWKREWWDNPPWYAKVPYIRAVCLYFEIFIMYLEAIFTEKYTVEETWNMVECMKRKYAAFYAIRYKPEPKKNSEKVKVGY